MHYDMWALHIWENLYGFYFSLSEANSVCRRHNWANLKQTLNPVFADFLKPGEFQYLWQQRFSLIAMCGGGAPISNSVWALQSNLESSGWVYKGKIIQVLSVKIKKTFWDMHSKLYSIKQYCGCQTNRWNGWFGHNRWQNQQFIEQC